MKKPKFKKNAARRLKKKQKYEQKRKEARKKNRLAYLEELKKMKALPEEELAKLLEEEGEDLEEFDEKY